jgi:hypothetical protein
MIRLRSSTRDWQDVLETAWNTLETGRAVDPERLQQACRDARAAVNLAFDEGLYDGLWWSHPRHDGLAPEFRVPTDPRYPRSGWDITDLGDALATATQLLLECAEGSPPIPPRLYTDTTRALEELRAAREHLAARILDLIEAEDPTRTRH